MKKEDYWDLIDTSIVVFVAYSLLVMVFPTSSLGTFVSSIISVVVVLFVFGLIGYNVVKEKSSLKPGKVGAWAGALAGLISAVVGILTYYLYPARIMEIIRQASSAGATAQITTTMIQIGLYINLIILPIIYALLGAFVTWISFLIFKNRK